MGHELELVDMVKSCLGLTPHLSGERTLVF